MVNPEFSINSYKASIPERPTSSRQLANSARLSSKFSQFENSLHDRLHTSDETREYVGK